MKEFSTVEKIMLTIVLVLAIPFFLAMNLYRFLGSFIEGIYLLWTGATDAQG